MRRLLPALLLGFGVTLAIVIGQRMSTDAMAVVIGVAVGVAASVPTSLLMVALLRKERAVYRPHQADFDQPGPYPPALPAGQQPNVIVLDPSMFARAADRGQIPLPPDNFAPDAGQRRLRVVGDE